MCQIKIYHIATNSSFCGNHSFLCQIWTAQHKSLLLYLVCFQKMLVVHKDFFCVLNQVNWCVNNWAKAWKKKWISRMSAWGWLLVFIGWCLWLSIDHNGFRHLMVLPKNNRTRISVVGSCLFWNADLVICWLSTCRFQSFLVKSPVW